METKVNYTAVGLFVLIFTLCLVGFIFWLGKYGDKKQQYDNYIVYSYETVSGLNIQSPVKFKGLDVGFVKSIQINPRNSEQIRINLEIKKNTPVTQSTYATISLIGITGLKYVELFKESHNSPTIEPDENGERVIRAKASLFDELGYSAQDMTLKANLVLNQLAILLNDDNLKSIENILNNLDSSSADLKHTMSNFNQIIEKIELIVNEKNASNIENILTNVESTTKHLSDGTQYLDNLINKDIKDTLKTVKTAALKTETAFNKFEGQIEEGKMDIKTMTNNTLKKMDTVFIEFERALQNLENTLHTIEDNPRDLFFKETKTTYGPGEKAQ